MVVQHNLTAMNANRYLGINNSKLSKSLEKLSSGYSINRAGDNAAGLAVSEKMRSQIAGMTQGVKNAQDGISMVQTFEGALTETDSILQRMKTLADQMANGSYDDPVDRAAAQQEFLQLNDELDQIADTDFNGVIVLNGGKMADGLEQVDGKFDYANKEKQIIAAANDMAAKNYQTTRTAYNEAKEVFKATKYDLSENGTAVEWNTLDNHAYDSGKATALWKDLGLDVADEQEVTITFKATAVNATTGAITWKADSGVTGSGATIGTAALGTLTAEHAPTNNVTGIGGFTVKGQQTTVGAANNTAGDLGTAIFDTKNVKVGDTVTLTYTNSEGTKFAPDTVGFNTNTYKIDKQSANPADSKLTLSVALPTTKIKDSEMTQTVEDGYTALEDVKFEAKYTTNAATMDELKLGGIDISKVGTAGKQMTINGQNLWIKLDADDNPTKITVSTVDNDAEGTELLNINITAAATNGTTNGSVSGNISISQHKYSDADGVTIRVGDDTKLASSNENTIKLNDAKAAYEKAIEDMGSISDYESAKAYLDKQGVSISDAFDKSEAKMTYKDSITLQVGARTKDAVNFTFKYNSDAIGDLEADLNCTAKGLGTDKLTIANQEAANYAIDKIDQAINKVSLVRGTFGAIQNRLEHKIDNMNVSIENLTSAESQIRDTNMPQEMMNFTKQQILAQASQSMLAQANQLPQGVLSLLQ